MDHAAGGRESRYTPEMGEVILARIAAGETVKQVCADPRTPSYATVYQWVRVHEDFAAGWRAVRARLARQAIAADAQATADRASLRTFKESLGVARRRTGGRRSSYTPVVGGKICRRVAAGAALSHVLAQPDMPSSRVVYRWLKTQPGFRRAYHRACLARERELELQVWLAVDRVQETLDLARGKAAVARLEGRMGRLVPKKYRALP
jgi:hypothetical protein